MERGVIRNREWATKIRDFSGLRFGNITPTDLDGMIEYRNKCFVFYESKFNGIDMPFGQQLAFERMIDDHNKPSVLFITEHNTDGDIDFANTIVKKFYFRGKWYMSENSNTLYKATDKFFNKYG